MSGVKYDGGKPRWSLLPTDVLWGAVKVLEHGARKYTPNNWMHVPNGVERYSDAAARHLSAIEAGEENDPDSGLPHAYHYLCSAIFVAWKVLNRPEELKAWRTRGEVVIPVESKAPWAQIEQLETEPAPVNAPAPPLDHEHVFELCDSGTSQIRKWVCSCGDSISHELGTNAYTRHFGASGGQRYATNTFFDATRAHR